MDDHKATKRITCRWLALAVSNTLLLQQDQRVLVMAMAYQAGKQRSTTSYSSPKEDNVVAHSRQGAVC